MTETKRIRVVIEGPDRITFEGFLEKERESIMGAAHGHQWVCIGADGRLCTSNTRVPLPAPAEDEEMLPFWRRMTAKNPTRRVQEQFREQLSDGDSPSLTIQSLCGYHYSPAYYANEAQKLEEYGFACLRSRRGADGQFWEIWYLPGLWAAKGELKKALAPYAKSVHGQLSAARKFLIEHVAFGSLDVMVQRAAMITD